MNTIMQSALKLVGTLSEEEQIQIAQELEQRAEKAIIVRLLNDRKKETKTYSHDEVFTPIYNKLKNEYGVEA